MSSFIRRSSLTLAMLAAASVSAAAQSKSAMMSDLMKDVEEVHSKLVQLAKAIPADKGDYRPESSVRSVNEVFLHVASDNYLMPTFAGVPMDPALKSFQHWW